LVGRYLVTTAVEETWPTKGEPVLFLGDWCRLHLKKAAWEKLDFVVAPYHWDDREKLHKDYLYIQSIYEKLLLELTEKLNVIHGVKYSVRYWRIIVGPWLGFFIQMLFDRWSMLRQVLRENSISGVRVLQKSEVEVVPNDFTKFSSDFISAEWNEAIYSQLLILMGISVETIYKRPDSEILTTNLSSKLRIFRKLKKGLFDVVSDLVNRLVNDDEYFFISSYLGRLDDAKLQAKLGQVPKRWNTVACPIKAVNTEKRKWGSTELLAIENFIEIARDFIPRHIPTVYLEGYLDLVEVAVNLPWPIRPKAIFTSNSFYADDVFKTWAAEKAESGVPVIIGQHGGVYGVALWNFCEDHEIAIADRFLTWGWGEPADDKVKPLGSFKFFSKKMKSDNAGKALLVEMTMPQNSYHMYSVTVSAGQWQTYFEDQCRFMRALPTNIRDQVLVRLSSIDYAYSQRQRWEEKFPSVQLDDGLTPLDLLTNQTRLYISTYNATTYLESMALNFPTIIFWNSKHWEIRESAIPYFEKLKSVGIFHETPESAAIQMCAVWDDVAAWWNSQSVQSVRQDFCKQYARRPKKPIDEMARLIREIAEKD
jgi:putative transferase (TIGR04331 family)